MKILVVNDDSIHAPGIEMLARAAARLGDVYVVAPAHQCSALSQKLTLRETLELKPVPDFPVPVKGAWQLPGTPVDCVKVALEHILPEKPDLVFSGINNGYNVGFDIAYSGTLGAAFEAVRNGVPAMAFSVTSDAHLPYIETYLTSVTEELIRIPLAPGEVWNVNFPALKTRPLMGILRDRIPANISLYTEHYQAEPGPDGESVLTIVGTPVPDEKLPEGTDAHAVRNGYISIGKVKGFGY